MHFSVVIPTFNRARVLNRCLDSVLAQTLSPQQIIVVDDGSTDETESLVSQYSGVKYLYQAQSGVSAARNTGIECAQSPWIALLDSDDEWLPEKLEQQSQCIRETGSKVCHTEEIWIRNGVRVNQMNKHKKNAGDIFAQSLQLCAMSPSSIVIHRDLLDEFGGFDERLPVCEDYDLWLQITACYSVALVEQPMIRKYGGHEDQLSRRYMAMDKYRVLAMEKLLSRQKLTPEKRVQVVQQLARKLKILAAGANKHNNRELSRFCQSRQNWLAEAEQGVLS